jgi:hypothetical protein
MGIFSLSAFFILPFISQYGHADSWWDRGTLWDFLKILFIDQSRF